MNGVCFVAINSAVEVDLTGQVNAEVAGGSYLGAVGGALDFMRAANQSPGGASLLVLPAARVVTSLSGPVQPDSGWSCSGLMYAGLPLMAIVPLDQVCVGGTVAP